MNKYKKYIKNPVIVEAVRFEIAPDIILPKKAVIKDGKIVTPAEPPRMFMNWQLKKDEKGIYIEVAKALDRGAHRVENGDFLIAIGEGFFEPIKPDIFIDNFKKYDG